MDKNWIGNEKDLNRKSIRHRIHAQAQDSQESQDSLGTIKQDPGKVPKNLGILGNLGPVHESCTKNHRDSWESCACAGFMKVLCQIMLFIRKNAFSLCFLMVNLRIGAEGLHFLVEFLKMENRILVLHYWVFFLRQMIAIEISFTYSVFKKHWYLQWFLHVPQFERWRCRYICDTPPPAGRPWEGGWPYICIYSCI